MSMRAEDLHALLDPARLWPVAVVVVPLAVVAAIAGLLLPRRPGLRHMLWATLLVLLAASPLLPRSDRLGAPRLDGLLAAAGDPAPTEPPAATSTSTSASIAAEAPAPPPASVPSARPADDDAFRIVTTLADGTARPEPAAMPDRAAPRLDAPTFLPLETAPTTTTPRAPHASARPITAPSAAAHDPAIGTDAATREPRPTAALAPIRAGDEIRDDRGATSTEGAAVPAPGAFADWAAFLRDARTLLWSVPAVPAELWGAGVALLILIVAARWIAFRGTIAAARPAPASVLALVREEAQRIGLRRVPRTVMVDRQLSPLVACGCAPTLVLPRTLWATLDDAGRRAVVMHELAHLRRRDHWLAWLDVGVGILYWWHPVAWWIRRRIREEADLACDAWVTALLPESRRAYATALLHAKTHTRDVPRWVPTLALGEHVRKTRFARRITMVMTHDPAPRATLAGAALAGALAVAGWLAAPSLACPPDQKEQTVHVEVHAPKAAAGPRTIVRVAPHVAVGSAHAADCCDDAGGHEAPHADANTFEQFMLGAMSPVGDEDLERRLAEMGAQLEQRIAQAVEQLQRKLAEAERNGDLDALMEQLDVDPALIREQAMQAARQAKQQAMEIYESVRAQAMRDGGGPRAPIANTVPPGTQRWIEIAEGDGPAIAMPDSGEMMSREYRLSSGKLEAFTALMVREDVPILVTPGDETITVHATPQQHRIVGAFIDLLEGRAVRAPAAAPGPRGAVPAPPAGPRAAPAPAPRGAESRPQADRMRRQMREMQQQQRREMQMRREEARRQLEELGARLREAEGRHREAEQHHDRLSAQIEALEERLDETRDALSDAPDAESKHRLLQSLERLGREMVGLQNRRTEAEFAMHYAEIEAATIEGELERIEGEIEARLERFEADMEAAMEAVEAELETIEEMDDDGSLSLFAPATSPDAVITWTVPTAPAVPATAAAPTVPAPPATTVPAAPAAPAAVPHGR